MNENLTNLPMNEQTKKNSNKFIVVLLILILIAILTTLGYLYVTKNDNKNNNANNNNNNTTKTDEQTYASYILPNKTEVTLAQLPIKIKIDADGKLKVEGTNNHYECNMGSLDKELVSIGLFEEGISAMDFTLLALTKDGELYIIYSNIEYYNPDSTSYSAPDWPDNSKTGELYEELSSLNTTPEGRLVIPVDVLKVDSDAKVKSFTDLYKIVGDRTGIKTGVYVLLDNGEIRLIEKNTTAKLGARYTGTTHDSEVDENGNA